MQKVDELLPRITSLQARVKRNDPQYYGWWSSLQHIRECVESNATPQSRLDDVNAIAHDLTAAFMEPELHADVRQLVTDVRTYIENL